METQNIQWKIEAGADGNVPDAQVTHALLMDGDHALHSEDGLVFHHTGCHQLRGNFPLASRERVATLNCRHSPPMASR
jgi:hypothetical protein